MILRRFSVRIAAAVDRGIARGTSLGEFSSAPAPCRREMWSNSAQHCGQIGGSPNRERRGKSWLPYTIWMICAASIFAVMPVNAAPPPSGCTSISPAAQADCALAQRFRPYIKTSLDGGGNEEQYRQTRWQWFVLNSTLKLGDQTKIAAEGWENVDQLTSEPGSDLTSTGADPGYTLVLEDKAIHGEVWADVAKGNGTYAHVERVGLKPVSGPDNRLINIDYTMIWSYNSARDTWIFEPINHIGDMTFLVVLYDPTSDRIVRLTYPAHGCILQIFELIPGQTVSIDTVAGHDFAGNENNISAANVRIAQSSEDDETEAGSNCSKYGAFLSSDLNVYFAIDPNSGKYEHPLVFVENGTHESFPNPGGRITNGGDHGGKGPSWLPGQATLLPSFNGPADDENMPFLHYNGKFGDDPATIVRHRTWCWPTTDSLQPCVYTSQSTPTPITGFSDMEPYKDWRQLKWPQDVRSQVSKSGDVYATAGRQNGSGSQSEPFGGLDVAATFTPAGWTLHLLSGTYDAPMLDRPMILTAQGGPVTLWHQ